MRKSSLLLLLICVPMLTAFSATAESAKPSGRQYSISLSSGRTIYRDGFQYGLGPDESVGLDVGAALNDKITLGVALGIDQLDLGFERNVPQLEASLNDKILRYTGSIFVEYAFNMGELKPYLGGHLGVHGVYYGYTTLYDDDDYGTRYHGLGYGFIAGARYRISPRFAVLAKIDAGRASSILASWYYRTHLGFTWQI